MKISEFQAGEKIKQPLLVGAVVNGSTNAGVPYLSITFKDSSGSIEGKLWDVKPEQANIMKVGTIVEVSADVISYRGVNQIKVLNVNEVNQDQIDMMNFIQTAPISKDELVEYINKNIENIQARDVKAVVRNIYDKYGDRIFVSPAATKNHHEFYSGLAMHITSMLKVANALCDIYPDINRDLLVGGVLLHDVGKIIELGGISNVEYTLEGKLLGHISISQTLLAQASKELGIETENILLLKHEILSHHGKYEFGSPVLPLTLEAEALHFIDDLDAKFTMINKELAQIDEGEFTSKLFALDSRAFYKHK